MSASAQKPPLPSPVPAQWRLRTRLVRGGTDRSHHGETSEALYLNSGFVYDRAETAEARFKEEDPGFTYSRLSNPTVEMFEKRMAAVEGAERARATATGMAAVTASMLSWLNAGDHVVSSRALFGSCHYVVGKLLPRLGIETSFIDGRDPENFAKALRPNTKAFFLETPSNPGLEIIDLKAVADIAHGAGAKLIIDNVFATPILQSPREFGADIVVYSATKHIDGQGRCLGGAILCDDAFAEDHLKDFLKHTGPVMSPFNAWVLLKGLETLDLRVAAQCAAADEMAEFLSAQPGIARVLYPFRADHPQAALAKAQMKAGGTVITFDLNGDKETAFRFANALGLIDISNNLGDTKSLITHPATTTHQRIAPEEREELGIKPGTLRLSVGLEDIADLQEDILQALEAV